MCRVGERKINNFTEVGTSKNKRNFLVQLKFWNKKLLNVAVWALSLSLSLFLTVFYKCNFCNWSRQRKLQQSNDKINLLLFVSYLLSIARSSVQFFIPYFISKCVTYLLNKFPYKWTQVIFKYHIINYHDVEFKENSNIGPSTSTFENNAGLCSNGFWMSHI